MVTRLIKHQLQALIHRTISNQEVASGRKLGMSRLQAKSFRRKAAAAAAASHGHGRPRWPARLMDGFRKMLVGLFSFPPRPPTVTFSVSDEHRRHVHSGRGGGGDAPKRSCSQNLHPLNAHYDEAIADCVEFFNRSARVDVRSRPQFPSSYPPSSTVHLQSM